MFCTQCGKQLDDNVTFCIYCGAKLEPSSSGGPAPVEQPAPFQPQMEETAPFQPQMEETAPFQPQTEETAAYQPQAAEPTPYQPQAAEPTPFQPQTEETAAYQPQAAEPTPYQPPAAEPTAYQPQAAEPAPYQPQAAADQQNPPGGAVPPDGVKPKKKKKVPVKAIVIISLVAVIAIGAVVAYLLINSPTNRMNRALEAGDLAKAYDIYENELKSGELSDRSAELLKDAAAKIQEDYLADSVTYEKAMEDLFYIRQFGCDEAAEALSTATDAVQTRHQVLTQLEAADAYYRDGSYAAAIFAYEDALALDPSNEDAANGLERARTAYYEAQFTQAKDLIAQGDYEGAIYIYQQVLFEDPTNTVAEDGIKAAEDAYRDEVVTAADRLADQGDFDGAVRTVQAAMRGHFADDEELAKAIEDLQEREIGQMADNVNDAADGGDWDGALNLLDDYQKRYPTNKSLQELREDILRKMPITLKNLTMVNSSSVEILTSVVSDRWGNIYDGAVRYNASSDAFGLYNLNKRYVTFTGTVFVPTNATNNKNMSFAIYLDEILVYYMDNITEETAPIPFEIDVTGATTLRIVTDNTGSSSYGHLYFADTSFSKAEDNTGA